MSLVSRIFGGVHDEARSVSELASIPRNSEQPVAVASVGGVDMRALQLVAVQACVGILGESVASLPLGAYRKTSGTRQEVSPTPPIVADPFPGLGEYEWKFQLVASMALRGNAFAMVTERDRYEYPTAMELVHPDMVQVDRDPGSGEARYRVGGALVPPVDMLHIRRFTMPGWLEGLSPVAAAAMSVGIAIDAERYGQRYFKDSATPSAVLWSESDLSDDQLTRNQQAWMDTHGGRRLPAFLSGGMRYQQISIAPGEAQFLETREYQKGEIASLYRIPPHMIGDTQKSTSWGSGIEQQSIGFVTYTLRPWLSLIESAWNRLLPRGQFVKFNIDALLRGDQKSRYDAYTQARMASWLSANEIRALEDLPPIADGDSYIQPLNYGPIGSNPLDKNVPAPVMGDDHEA